MVNVAAGVIALVALRLAAIPADANHPYGHDKAEFFAAVIEGVLIVVAALSIFEHAWAVWRHPRPLGTPLQGIGLNAVATVLNRGWSLVLLRAGAAPALAGAGRRRAPSGGRRGDLGRLTAGGRRWWCSPARGARPLLAAATGVYVLWSGMR